MTDAKQPRTALFLVSAECEGMRLDAALPRLFIELPASERVSFLGTDGSPSRAQFSKWIDEGRVRVASRECRKPAYRITAGERIEVAVPPPPASEIEGDPGVELSVIFEDEEIIVVDKPAGLVVHPGAGCRDKTLAHGLLHHVGADLSRVGHPLRPGIVHRLDRGTSGLLVVAKTQASYHDLIRQFQPPRSISRSYLAVVASLPKAISADAGTIELPIGRDPVRRERMSIQKKKGREATTRWRVVERLGFGAVLSVSLETGRTHQIRVHLQHMGAPVFGDPVYGPPLRSLPPKVRNVSDALGRQALHAQQLRFIHPRSRKEVEFESPLPADITAVIEQLRGFTR